jgi:hypothetical protein
MAGFLGFNNYQKEGPGISKDAPKKKTFIVFFEMFFYNTLGDNLKLFHRVKSSCCTGSAGGAAYDAATLCFTFELFSVCIYYVNVKKPPQRAGFFNGYA